MIINEKIRSMGTSKKLMTGLAAIVTCMSAIAVPLWISGGTNESDSGSVLDGVVITYSSGPLSRESADSSAPYTRNPETPAQDSEPETRKLAGEDSDAGIQIAAQLVALEARVQEQGRKSAGDARQRQLYEQSRRQSQEQLLSSRLDRLSDPVRLDLSSPPIHAGHDPLASAEWAQVTGKFEQATGISRDEIEALMR